MEALAGKYKDKNWVEFLVVYQKEAHPEEGIFREVTQPVDYRVRKTHAERLVKEFSMRNDKLLVDEIDNRVSRLYGNMPNMVFVINPDGKLGFVSSWTKTYEVEEFLAQAANTATFK